MGPLKKNEVNGRSRFFFVYRYIYICRKDIAAGNFFYQHPDNENRYNDKYKLLPLIKQHPLLLQQLLLSTTTIRNSKGWKSLTRTNAIFFFQQHHHQQQHQSVGNSLKNKEGIASWLSSKKNTADNFGVVTKIAGHIRKTRKD